MVVFEPAEILIIVVGVPLALWPYEMIRNVVELRDSAAELASGGRTGIDGRPPRWISLTRLIGIAITIFGATVLFGGVG